MKHKLVVLVTGATAGLALAGAAQAGCMATVGLSSTPRDGLAAGTPWVVTVRVLQHGRTPMPDARPKVRIRAQNGKPIVFRTTRTTRVGSYRARVVFPEPGTYALGVYDGFPVKECARLHTFGTVVIAGD